jgi:hypothetical protein
MSAFTTANPPIVWTLIKVEPNWYILWPNFDPRDLNQGSIQGVSTLGSSTLGRFYNIQHWDGWHSDGRHLFAWHFAVVPILGLKRSMKNLLIFLRLVIVTTLSRDNKYQIAFYGSFIYVCDTYLHTPM